MRRYKGLQGDDSSMNFIGKTLPIYGYFILSFTFRFLFILYIIIYESENSVPHTNVVYVGLETSKDIRIGQGWPTSRSTRR
jgi:hypothetical protein